MSKPSLLQLPIWENRKLKIFQLLDRALILLRNNAVLPREELLLNRELYKCMKRAALEMQFDFLPTPEGKNPPSESDEERAEREDKIPDLYWQIPDHVNGVVRYFVVECKRLGPPSSPSWKLNENYVRNGVRRFITSPHEYGKDEDAAGMVGYLQGMEFDEVLKEVNMAAKANAELITELELFAEGWQENGVSKLSHELERPFAISPFLMHHFWVDIRTLYRTDRS